MKRVIRLVSIILVIVMITSLLSGCKSTATANELRLGLVSPLTGSGAASGLIQENAAKMAVDEINAAGGIGGKIKIKLISEDDEGVPAKSVTVTQKLVSQDRIQVMIGALNSSCTLADMEITSKDKIPQIAPSSTAASITQQSNKYIFRNAASDVTHVATMFKYITDNNYKKVAILHESSDFGAGGAKLIEAKAKELGVEISNNEVYNTGEKDFSVQLTKIKTAAPDIILIYGYYSEVALICKQVKQYDIQIPLLGTGYNSPKLIELGGDAVNGIMFTTPFTAANPDTKIQAFIEKYVKLYNQTPDQNAAQVYDAVYIVAKAVETAGLDSQKICNAIAATKDFPGMSGITNFDANGEVIKDISLVQIVNGKQELMK